MSTASTKRDRNKGGRPGAAQAAATPKAGGRETQPPAAAPAVPEISDSAWLILSLAVLAAAAFLRLYALELKPFHHDEGVNGFFLEKLLRQGAYKYDPTNYHGPTLYYLTLPSVALFGLNDFAVRFVTALSGVGTVALVLRLRRHVGAIGALAGAALVAFSPGAVFYSRYFIHESLFVFFTLGVVVAALRFYETGGAAYLMLCAGSAALLFATKETAFMSAATLALALLCVRVWEGMTGGGKPPRGATLDRRGARPGGAAPDSLLTRLGGGEQALFLAVVALSLFFLVCILLYSSFFTNPQGVGDAVRALAVWQKTGASDFHAKPFYTYANWLTQEEGPILALAVVGAAVALAGRRTDRFALFTGAWAFGILLAYSLVAYKTPWLALNFVAPMAIVGGYAVGWFDRQTGGARSRHLWAAAVMALALAVSGYQTFVLNFRQYDNDQYPYVYSHTQRGAVELVRAIQEAGLRAGAQTPGVSVASPEYWPLPWYFRDNARVAYDGSVRTGYDPNSTLAVVGRVSNIAAENQLPQLQRELGENYRRVGDEYPLRPGVRLVLFVRRDLAGG